jgi:hypothetical protein
MLAMVKVASRTLGVACPIQSLTVGMFKRDGQHPSLHCKAAEARKLLPIIVHLLENGPRPRSQLQELRHACVGSLNQCYVLMENWSADAGSALVRHANEHLMFYAKLGVCCVTDGPMARWRIYPKHHLFIHLSQEVSSSGCPRAHWNYMDESNIGDASVLAIGCHPQAIARTVLAKYRFKLADNI